MKQLFFFLFLFISAGSSAQCLEYDTDKGEDCGNPNSLEVNIENNCGSKKYVVALCYDENRKVYNLLAYHIESGRKASNWTCECYNVKVRYWDFDAADEWAAYRSGQEYIKRCKAKNSIE